MNFNEDLHFTFHSLHRLKCTQQFGLLPVCGSKPALLVEHCSTNVEDMGLNPKEVLKIVLRLICKILFTLRSVKVFLLRGSAVTVIKHQSKKNMTRTTPLQFSSQPCLFCACVSAVAL